MKKSFLLGIILTAAAFLLCGFDTSLTAEDVLQKSIEESGSASSFTTDFDFNLDMGVDIGDGSTTSTIDLLMNMDLTIDMTMDPYVFQIDGTVLLSLFGTDETDQVEAYAVLNDDGTLKTYTYSEEEEGPNWTYSETSGYDFSALEQSSGTFNAEVLSEYGIPLTLASETVDVNGTECYLLNTDIDIPSLESLLDSVEDETVQSVLDLLDGLVLNISYYVATDTFLPIAVHMDLNDSDLSVINAYLSELLGAFDVEDAQTSVELICNDVSMDFEIAYDTIDSITIPQEALDAASASESYSDLFIEEELSTEFS